MLFFAAVSAAANAGPESAPRLAVVAPRTQSGSDILGPAVGRFVHQALVDRGIATVPFEQSGRRSVDDSAEAVRLLAERLDADQVVLATWGRVERAPVLELFVFDASTGELADHVSARAPLSRLGETLVDVTTLLWGPMPRGDSVRAPELWELARYGRAEVYLANGQLPEAWRALDRLDSPVVRSLRAAIDQKNARADNDPSRRSRLATASGRPDPDWSHIRAGLTRSPGPELLLAAAEAASARRDVDLALQLFSRARDALGRASRSGDKHHPLERTVLAGLARSQSARGDHAAARETYSQWADRDPVDPTPLAEAAELPEDDARKAATRWVAAADRYRRVYESRLAERAYARAVELDPDRTAEVASKLASMAADWGREREAARHFAQAERHGGLPAPMHELRGYIALGRNEIPQALRHFRAAQSISPKRPATLAGLGLALVAAGESEEGVEILERALALDPTEGTARLALARWQQSRGDKARARKTLADVPPGTSERAALGYALGAMLAEESDPEAASTLSAVAHAYRGDPNFQRVYAKALNESGDAALASERRRRAETLRRSSLASRQQPLPVEDSLRRLVESFPLEGPTEASRLQRVGFIGLTRPLVGWERLRFFYAPGKDRLARLEDELIAALAKRYDVERADPPEAFAAAALRVRDFKTGLVDVAGLNRQMRTDAVFTARLVGHSGAGGGLLLEARLLGGVAPDHAFILTNEIRLDPAQLPGSQIHMFPFILSAIALLCAFLGARRISWDELEDAFNRRIADAGYHMRIRLARLRSGGDQAAPPDDEEDRHLEERPVEWTALPEDEKETEHESERIGDRYVVLGELGRGGMGVVLKARDERLRRIVALKQLRENARGNPVAKQLFLREARAAASLNHPNIVTVYDVDEWDGGIVIAMEYLEGEGLDAILKRKGHLTPEDASRIGAQICSGLSYAHARDLVHRDVKTSNLFLTHNRIVKIMDFGLAKFSSPDRPARGGPGGTPYFMSPEQTRGEPVDHRSDLYSFGVTLFHLLTGHVPYGTGDIAEQHRTAPVPDPRELKPDIPEALVRLIRALLAKRPEDRPIDATWVGQRLVGGFEKAP